MYVIVVDVKTATYDLLLDLISKLDILFGTYFLVKMRMFVLYMNSYIIFLSLMIDSRCHGYRKGQCRILDG